MKHELRIGNTVKCESYIATVDQLKHDSIVLRDTDGVEVYATYEDISGIPLTSDLLERMGFNDKTYNDGFTGILIKTGAMNTDFVLTKPNTNIKHCDYYCWQFKSGRLPMYNKFKHVHELQNFFFALTGQELTPKPETR